MKKHRLSQWFGFCFLLLLTASFRGVSAEDGAATLNLRKPVSGTVFTAPANIAIEVVAVDLDGDIRLVEFYANGQFVGKSEHLTRDAVIPGNPREHFFTWSNVSAGSYRLVAKAKATSGVMVESNAVEVKVEPAGVDVVLVPAGAEWRHWNKRTAPGEGWNQLEFDASSWLIGKAELGYGDGDEVTRTEGAGFDQRPVTAYFRRGFEVSDPLAFSALTLKLLRDDGAVVYLNGQQVVRDNMPDGPVTPETLAVATIGGEEEQLFRPFEIPAKYLRAGRNLIAVEVHQVNVASSDLSFNLALGGVSGQPSTRPIVRIEATTPETSEPSPLTRVAPGVFTVSRTGDLRNELAVYLDVGGTASPEKDYAAISSPVVIPAGAASATVRVAAVQDELVEGTETVVAKIVWPFLNPLPPDYDTDPAKESATVMIHDANSPTGATLKITAPQQGQVFTAGQTITINATAIDPRGYIARVEFYDFDSLIGVSEIAFFTAPEPGTPIEHTFEWKGASVSKHLLTARAVDSAGNKVISAPVEIAVVDGTLRTTVSVWAHDEIARELAPEISAIDPAGFTVSREGDLSRDLLVYFTLHGSAMAEKDYNLPLSPVLIQAGQKTTTVAISPKIDQETEKMETVSIRLEPPPEDAGTVPYDIVESGKIAAAVIYEREAPAEPEVALAYPSTNAEFGPNETIPLWAAAFDPVQDPSTVEFYAGSRKIGESVIIFDRVTSGGLIIHPFYWKETIGGRQEITAKLIGANGTVVSSSAIVIFVGSEPVPEQPVVIVEARDALAAETGPEGVIDPAVFLIKRVSGPTDVALNIFYKLSGTALNGIDYSELSGTVSIPAGRLAAEIVVKPIPDKALEGEETVIITLEPPACIAIAPPPPDCYRVGDRASARAVIKDSEAGGNLPPRVTIHEPKDGAVFTVGQEIKILASAMDLDGTVSSDGTISSIARLEIWVDGVLLKSAESAEVSAVWTGAKPGTHSIVAKAWDSQNAGGISAPVRIMVVEVDRLAFVKRELPDAFLPPVPFTVQLIANPPAGTSAYGVEDQPFVGSKVSNISHNGTFDATTGKVKFGPFTDGQARVLSYEVLPPPNDSGRYLFTGSSAANGQAYPIVGDQVIQVQDPYHPADGDLNKTLVLTEVTAYAAAWKEGGSWRRGPVPIPISYVTRAGMIWHRGEAYVFDAAAGAPPACWVPLEQTRQDIGGGTAMRSIAGAAEPGAPLEVSITVTPASGTSAYAVKEKVPQGWSVTILSGEGRYDAEAGVIRWGLFLDATARVLKYRATPPPALTSVGYWSGVVSFDGNLQEIAGGRSVVATDASTELALPGITKENETTVSIELTGPAGQLCILEASSDLLSWDPVGTVYLADGVLRLDDDGAKDQRYYRLRVP